MAGDNPNSSEAKIFCVGFHKTGTTSMMKLLSRLGYRVQGAYKVRDTAFVDALTRGDLRELFDRALKYDAFADNPWPIFFRELDFRFPASRFLLTIRDEDLWIRSVVNHFGRQPEPSSPMRRLIYGAGSPVGNEARYLERFRQHIRDVSDYFSQRQGDLLTVDVSQPQALGAICSFLGHRTPRWRRMPHANRRLS